MRDELTKAVDAYRVAKANAVRLHGDYVRLKDMTHAAYLASQNVQRAQTAAGGALWRIIDPKVDVQNACAP